ncbi:MAG: hypothetical protein ACLGHV_11440 [Gammaproteobacteria bacterium]
MDPISVAMGLAQFAPQIIRWVSGSDKAEEAARQVVDIAATVTGKRGNEALEAMQFDPKLALDFRKAVLEVEADLDKAYLLDVQHARATHREHWMPWVLSLTLVAMVSGTVAGLLLVEVPPGNKEVLYLIVGQLIAAFVTAVAYWLGSSRGSAVKQDDINRALASMRR